MKTRNFHREERLTELPVNTSAVKMETTSKLCTLRNSLHWTKSNCLVLWGMVNSLVLATSYTVYKDARFCEHFGTFTPNPSIELIWVPGKDYFISSCQSCEVSSEYHSLGFFQLLQAPVSGYPFLPSLSHWILNLAFLGRSRCICLQLRLSTCSMKNPSFVALSFMAVSRHFLEWNQAKDKQ